MALYGIGGGELGTTGPDASRRLTEIEIDL